MPDSPEYDPSTASHVAGSNLIYGGQYQFYSGPNTDVHTYNVPCAVCYAPDRAASVMIPAKTTCPLSWTREYYGYLTGDHDSHYRNLFTCIDANPEVIPGTSGFTNGVLFLLLHYYLQWAELSSI